MKLEWQQIASEYTDDQLIEAANHFEKHSPVYVDLTTRFGQAMWTLRFISEALAQRLQKANEQYNELLAHIGPDTRIDDI